MGFAKAWDDVTGMLAVPVVGTADTKHIVLLVGIVIAAFVGWSFVIGAFRSIAEEVV